MRLASLAISTHSKPIEGNDARATTGEATPFTPLQHSQAQATLAAKIAFVVLMVTRSALSGKRNQGIEARCHF